MEEARDFRQREVEEAWEEAERRGRGTGASDARRFDEPGSERLGDQLRRGRDEAQSLGSELADVASDLGTLVQQEVRLAKAELGEQVGKAVQSIALGAAAASFATLMSVFLFVGVMLVIAEAIALWIAAFITTGILLVLAVVAALVARQRIKQMNLVPERTVESVKEDLEWAKNQIKSSRK